MTLDKTSIRDAATLILVRDPCSADASVLMGQRHPLAAFMPSKFVFPGGAVDPSDKDVPVAQPINDVCLARLAENNHRIAPTAVVAAAIRELWEETGLILGQAKTWPQIPPEPWAGFAATGHLPSPDGLRFIFRAITPPGRPRRFDARFFLANATAVCGDLDDFSLASDELSNLRWIPLREVRKFDLPFITEVVLAEVAARLPDLDAPDTVPFFRNDDEQALFLRLGRGVL